MFAIEVDGLLNTENLKSINTVIAKSASDILTTGANMTEKLEKAPEREGKGKGKEPAGTSIVKSDEEELFEEAIRAYNQEEAMLSKFVYPKNYAMLGLDASEPKGSGTYGSMREGLFTSGDKGPYTTGSASNRTLEAMFALLANRQNIGRAWNNYPLTFFVGSRHTGDTNIKLFRDTDMFSRVVFGTLEAGDEKSYTAIIQFTKGYPRKAVATVWVPSEKEGPLKNVDIKSEIGGIVKNRWNDLRDLSRDSTTGSPTIPSLINTNDIESLEESDFMRGTGSKEIHSLLWPVVKLCLTKDDSKIFSNLGTEQVSKSWPSDTIKGFKGSTMWHQWTMGILAMGSIPYLVHSNEIEPPDYKRHMSLEQLKKFSKVVKIKQV